MSTLKRIRRVTIETERTFVVRSRGVSETARCARCGAEIEMVDADTAAREAGISELAIYHDTDFLLTEITKAKVSPATTNLKEPEGEKRS